MAANTLAHGPLVKNVRIRLPRCRHDAKATAAKGDVGGGTRTSGQ